MVNHTIVQGRLTRDPEMRYTQSNTPVTSFTVAWSEKYKETEKQLFLDCTAWNGTAELVSKHFVKGKEIIVEGKLGTRKWEDKEGKKRSSTELTVERVHFCGSKSAATSDGCNASENPYSAVTPSKISDYADINPDDGELPF